MFLKSVPPASSAGALARSFFYLLYLSHGSNIISSKIIIFTLKTPFIIVCFSLLTDLKVCEHHEMRMSTTICGKNSLYNIKIIIKSRFFFILIYTTFKPKTNLK